MNTTHCTNSETFQFSYRGHERQFPIQSRYGGIRKVKEIKGLRGGVRGYAAQAILQIDAEIAEKGHFWMETSYYPIFSPQ
jgi:hypothetical protein